MIDELFCNILIRPLLHYLHELILTDQTFVTFLLQICLFMYNWSTELCNNLERQLLRLVQWHNARCQVLLGIFSQKMGLYQHNPVKGLNNCDAVNDNVSQSLFFKAKHVGLVLS